MTPSAERRDLIVLTADLDMRLTMNGLLGRHQSLGIREISFKVISHLNRDAGVFKEGHNLLRTEVGNFQYALAVCDHHGCGQEGKPREHVESIIAQNLTAHWRDRSAAIVIEPELESWVWTDSPHLTKAIGWPGNPSSLRVWLKQEGFRFDHPIKPLDPKGALERVLRYMQKKKSSALYQQLSRTNVSTADCTDPAFAKLRDTLQKWFPAA